MQFAYVMDGVLQIYQQSVRDLIYKIVWVVREEVSVSIKRKNLRGITAQMLSEICKETKIKPKLILVRGKELEGRTANTTNKVVRVDIRALEDWERGQ